MNETVVDRSPINQIYIRIKTCTYLTMMLLKLLFRVKDYTRYLSPLITIVLTLIIIYEALQGFP